MADDRFASAHEMVREYQELEKQMADPSIHEDQNNARKLGRRYAQLGPVVAGGHLEVVIAIRRGRGPFKMKSLLATIRTGEFVAAGNCTEIPTGPYAGKIHFIGYPRGGGGGEKQEWQKADHGRTSCVTIRRGLAPVFGSSIEFLPHRVRPTRQEDRVA